MKFNALITVLACIPILLGANVEDEKVDFEAILVDALEDFDLSTADFGVLDLNELLESKHFFNFELAAWDVCVPVQDLKTKDGVLAFQEAIDRTLAVADVWAGWTITDEDALEEVHDDVKVLRKWVKGWSKSAFKKAIKTEGDSLFERMSSANEKVKAAGERIAERMGLVQTVAGRKPAHMVFIPIRKTFVELVALAGAIEPDRKKLLWSNDSAFGTAAWSSNTHFIALEYATWPNIISEPYRGDHMSNLIKTGRSQHVIERAANTLSRGAFNAFASPLLEQALHINFVIEINGGDYPTFNTWSFQFSRAGGSTAPFSRFVPGGNAAGGTLPARQASAGPTTGSSESTGKSVWRENDGSDYFLEALKRGQKKGLTLVSAAPDVPAELQRDKRPHFAIGIEGKSEVTLMSAPFLGDVAAKKKAPADEFIDEYEQFFRSYRASFTHWLRTSADPEGEAESLVLFAKLLNRAGRRTEQDTLSTMVKEVYGLPLSAYNGETDSLEWRFLTYIHKSR